MTIWRDGIEPLAERQQAADPGAGRDHDDVGVVRRCHYLRSTRPRSRSTERTGVFGCRRTCELVAR